MARARARLAGCFLVSHHIAKTAGTTLAQILVRNVPGEDMIHTVYGPEAVSAMGTWNPEDVARAIRALPPEELARRWYVGGHIPGSTMALLPRPGRIVTMLRDPAERAISNFYAVVRRGIVPDVRPDTTLEEYLREPAPHYWFSDAMARSLSGDPRLDPFDLPLSARVSPDRALSEADVAAGCRRLREDAALVGLAERFDEFLVLLAGLLSWSLCDIAYTGLNIRDRAAQPAEGRPEVREAVLRWNRADVRLHAEAAALEQDYRADYGVAFEADLALFRRLNAAYADGAADADLQAMERDALRAR